MSLTQRNWLNNEIRILTNRLTVLQEQEKSYEDLSDAIKLRQNALIDLNKSYTKLEQDILDRQREFNRLWIDVKLERSEVRLAQEELKWLRRDYHQESEQYLKNKKVYSDHLDRMQNTLADLEDRIRSTKEKLEFAETEYEEYKKTVKEEKSEIFDKVMNNENIIEDQEEKIINLKKSVKDLENEYNDLDKNYQKLLEEYILKQ